MSKPVIAVTGSNGKTVSVVREFAQARSRSSRIYEITEQSLGGPLSLQNAAAAEVGIFEIGTNQPGEIETLPKNWCPDIAVLLNVAGAHIGNFEDLLALSVRSCANGLRRSFLCCRLFWQGKLKRLI